MSKPPKKQPNKPQDKEARLDRLIRSSLGRGPNDYLPEQWRGLREHLRLSLLYPGQFVAYRDHYEGEEQTRQLVHREVMCSSGTLSELHALLAELPQEVQRRAQVSYVETNEPPAHGH